MEPIYRYSESTIKPVEVEIGKHTVFLRKDFVETERAYDDTTITIWSYQEAKMTHEEFAEYSNFIAAKNAANISNILTGQENGDNNQLIIMEAIADLYDAIASLM